MTHRQAYEAWWMPAHVAYRYVAIDATGAKSWHKTLADAQARAFPLTSKES